MSIRDAVITATRQTLSTYLAPELVEQLTDEIVHRMAPELESAIGALTGFEFGRPQGPARVRGATLGAKKAAKARGRKEGAQAGEGDEDPAAHVVAHHHNHGNGGEPAPSQMS